MSILISAHNIAKSFGSQILFKELSFSIESEQRIGLIGPNGAGKSTLMQILTKEQTVDAGEISFAKGLRLAYLSQSPIFENDATVFSAINEMTDDPQDAMSINLTQELIARLKLDGIEAGEERLVRELSGGWKKRVALARELAKKPNLLLLDEPTNHLDLPSIMWLENFLSEQRELGVLIITHDRLFLQNTCNTIFDLDKRNPNGLIKCHASYVEFLIHKENLLEAQKSYEASRRNVLGRETEWLRRGAIARQTKQKARIGRADILADEVSDLKERNLDRVVNVDFGEVGRSPKRILEATEISKAFEQKLLFQNFSFLLGPKARVGVVGANGSGKTTLIRTLIGEVPADSGEVWISDKVSFSYFEQNKESLDPEVSLLKTLCPEGDYVDVQGTPVYVKSYLSRFLFRPEQMDLPVKKLSGGEQSRLLIARMMMHNDEVLILDEPTNDLDIATLDVLQKALADFPGAVILVTHDRFFMDQVVNQILALTEDKGEVIRFADYFQWEQWFRQKELTKQKKPNTNSPPKSKEKNQSKGRLTYKDQRELDLMESTILQAEEQLSDLQHQLSLNENQNDYSKLQTLTEELHKKQNQVDKLYVRWQELQKMSENSD